RLAIRTGTRRDSRAEEAGRVEYRIINGDGHIDPEALPKDTFTSRVGSKWKDSAPRVAEREGHLVWTAEGIELGLWGPEPFGWYLTAGHRGVRMRSMGFDPEQLRPGDPELHLEDLLKDGCDAEVIYGPLRRWDYFAALPDDAADAFARAYNEFLAEFCATHPERFFGLGNLPMVEDLQTTCASLEHVAQLGLVGV